MSAMTEVALNDALAVWGAGLSTLLACVKLHELWRDRFRLEIDYDFSSDREFGSKITIRNISSRPVTITYKELLIGRSFPFFRGLMEVPGTNEEPYDISIPAHSSETISYQGESHFSISGDQLAGKSLFLKVWIAGRKPMLLLVYKSVA
ncbi:MAG: hypothetical protein O9256_00550 [Rhizobiaceae bacterium]|nr:hypothetical protein [Rhizobiaceae bacterium]